MNETKQKKKEGSALCSPSKLPASNYVINPYTGCTHRCMYCYASFMGRFSGHTGEPWGTYLVPKQYKAMKLPHDLKGKTILVGSVTDAYNPGEKQYRMMPDILHTLSHCEAHVEILTKSSLILRDLELLRRIPDLAVGISLSNLNQTDNDVLEPNASSASKRLETLETLHRNGITTYLFVAPYLPGITSLKTLAESSAGYVDYICVENLNLRGAGKTNVLNALVRLHPELAPLYREIYLQKGGSQYWHTVELEIETLRQSADIPVISYLYHEKIRKNKKKKGKEK